MNIGSVTWKTYKEYLNSARSPFRLKLLIASFFLAQIAMSGHDYSLSFWYFTTQTAKIKLQNSQFTLIFCIRRTNAEEKQRDCAESLDPDCDDGYLGEYAYLGIYTGFAAATVVFCLYRSIYFYVYCTKISINLHNWMFTSMVRAPTKFYDENPSGEVALFKYMRLKFSNLREEC